MDEAVQKAHELRVLEEKGQLHDRQGKLVTFMMTDTFKKLSEPEQRLMIQQELVMSVYLEILRKRIELFPR